MKSLTTRAERQSWPKVAIIILNWNGWMDTIECLESLERITYPNCQVIVVDNGSTDNSVEKIKEWARGKIVKRSKFLKSNLTVKPVPSIQYARMVAGSGGAPDKEREIKQLPLPNGALIIIEVGQNLGFSGGNNIGIKLALAQSADYVLLLNNDTVVAPDFLDKMIEAAENNIKVGLVGPKVYYYQDPGTIQYAGGQISLLTGRPIIWAAGEHDKSKLSGCREVTFVTGCSMLVKANVFRDVGFLDEHYFLGMEDVDFSYRSIQKGWKLICCLEARVWHKLGASAGREDVPMVWYYDSRNRLYFVIRRTSGILHKIVFILAFFAMRLFNLWRLPMTGRTEHLRASNRGVFDFALGRMGKGFTA